MDVVLWDERRTTIEAHNILSAGGKKMKSHRKNVDAVAASLILEAIFGFWAPGSDRRFSGFFFSSEIPVNSRNTPNSPPEQRQIHAYGLRKLNPAAMVAHPHRAAGRTAFHFS